MLPVVQSKFWQEINVSIELCFESHSDSADQWAHTSGIPEQAPVRKTKENGQTTNKRALNKITWLGGAEEENLWF